MLNLALNHWRILFIYFYAGRDGGGFSENSALNFISAMLALEKPYRKYQQDWAAYDGQKRVVEIVSANIHRSTKVRKDL